VAWLTVVIAFLSHDYSILATDTRFSFDRNGKKVMDNAVKLKPMNYPHGWYVGMGYSRFIQNYYHLVSNAMLTTREEHLAAFGQVAQETLAENNPNSLNHVITTNLFISCMENNNLIIHSLRVHPSGQTQSVELPPNRIIIGFPWDVTEEKQSEIKENYAVHEDISLDYPDVLNKILIVLKLISSTSEVVSEYFDIGIHKKAGLNRYSFSGQIDELLENETIKKLL
jgi:hypothetical protein